MNLKNNLIKLIKVNDGRLTIFSSLLEKQLFLNTHKKGTFRLVASGNAAIENLYIIIDTEGSGFVLTKKGVTYNEAIDIINHYI